MSERLGSRNISQSQKLQHTEKQQKILQCTAEFFQVSPNEVKSVRSSLEERSVTYLQILKGIFFMPWQKCSVIPMDIKGYLVNGLAIVATVCHLFMMFSPCIMLYGILSAGAGWMIGGLVIYLIFMYLPYVATSMGCGFSLNSRTCPIEHFIQGKYFDRNPNREKTAIEEYLFGLKQGIHATSFITLSQLYNEPDDGRFKHSFHIVKRLEKMVVKILDENPDYNRRVVGAAIADSMIQGYGLNEEDAEILREQIDMLTKYIQWNRTKMARGLWQQLESRTLIAQSIKDMDDISLSEWMENISCKIEEQMQECCRFIQSNEWHKNNVSGVDNLVLFYRRIERMRVSTHAFAAIYNTTHCPCPMVEIEEAKKWRISTQHWESKKRWETKCKEIQTCLIRSMGVCTRCATALGTLCDYMKWAEIQTGEDNCEKFLEVIQEVRNFWFPKAIYSFKPNVIANKDYNLEFSKPSVSHDDEASKSLDLDDLWARVPLLGGVSKSSEPEPSKTAFFCSRADRQKSIKKKRSYVSI